MINRLAIVLSLLLLACPGAEAREVSRTMGLSQRIFEALQEVQELIEKGSVDEAEDQLENLQRGKLSDYALAQTWFLMGYIHYRGEDFPAALAAYEKVLENENLPLGMQQNVLKTLAQLSAFTEDYTGALSYLERLLALGEDPQPEDYALKAQILFQMQRMDESLTALHMAFQLQAKRGTPPREHWLLLKNGILYQQNDYRGMLLVVQQLVDLYPKDRYLLNMAAIYGELGNDKMQLALMEPLYERGGLRSASQKVNLASLYMLHDIPFKAAALLERELKSQSIKSTKQNIQMLAQAWLLSAEAEHALIPLAQAAEISDDGDNYIKLARTCMSLTRWGEAERSLQKALDKGELTDHGGALLMLGMAQFNQKNYRDARRSFARAGQDPKTEKLARQWLHYLETEEEKSKLLTPD